MKAIKDVLWQIEIIPYGEHCWYWRLKKDLQNVGFELTDGWIAQDSSGESFDKAKENFIEFAKLNEITNYKFVE